MNQQCPTLPGGVFLCLLTQIHNLMSTPKQNIWGGKREGAGAPRLDDNAETKIKSVSLTTSQIAFLESLGDGNFSQGVRRAVSLVKQMDE